MKARLRGIIRHPLVAIPPLVLVLMLGWQQYTYAGRDLNLPLAALNLLPNSNFSQIDGNGIPVGWSVAKSGDLSYTVGSNKGYTGSVALGVGVSDYQSGDIALSSPKVTVGVGATYLFKDYYKSDTAFALLARYYAMDGSSTLQLVRTYPATGTTWSTTSHAFTAATNTVAVQFVYRMYTDGNLQLNSPYLEPRQDVYVAPPELASANTVPNAALALGSYNAPEGWSTYHSGDSTAMFTYQQDPAGAYVEARLQGHTNGQAKWQYTPQSVQPDQYCQAAVTYRSDTPVSLVAEYALQNGQRQDQTVADLPPADDWTTATYQFQTVPNATDTFISLPLQHDGTVASRNYTLTNITRPGAAHWQQSVASITFDDGWRSAYENAQPLLQQYNYKATFYINPSTIETPGFMTASQVTDLSNAGNEIAAHGYEHDDMTAINTSALNYQLREGRDYLRDAGFQVSDFAPPYGRSDAEVQWQAREDFATMRGSGAGINTRQNLEPYNLKVLDITPQTNPQTITTALQQAKAYHGWLILSYHQVSDQPDDYGSLRVEHATITSAALSQQLNLIRASGIKVLPITAAYQTLEPSAKLTSH